MSEGSTIEPAGPKSPVPWFYWPYWMTLLAAALFLFYVILTPVWMGIRLVAWLSERGRTGADPEEGDRVTRTCESVPPGGTPG